MENNDVLICTISTEAYEWCHWSFSNYIAQEASNWIHFQLLIVFNNSTDGWVNYQKVKWNEVNDKLGGAIQPFHYINIGEVKPGMRAVGTARNAAFDFAVKNGFKYVYFVDIDNYGQAGSLQVLLNEIQKYDASIIGAKYYKRLYDPVLNKNIHVICAMFTDSFSREMTAKSALTPGMKLGTIGLNKEVIGVGFGCSMISSKAFDKIRIPEMTGDPLRYRYKNESYESEDLPFCRIVSEDYGQKVLWTDSIFARHLHRNNGDIIVF